MIEPLLIGLLLICSVWIMIKIIKPMTPLHPMKQNPFKQRINQAAIGLLLVTALGSWLISAGWVPTASADRMPDMKMSASSTSSSSTGLAASSSSTASSGASSKSSLSSVSDGSGKSSTSNVSNADDFKLTDGAIEQQNQSAVRMMNEQALSPTILPDGTKQFVLNASTFAWSLYPGKIMEGWGFNGSIPGSLIRVTVGDQVDIVVHNLLSEPMTVHWHGLQVPNAMDGVPGMPNPAIQPNGSFHYKFTVTEQMVGTHWYHSHYDDDFQVDAGMYGAIIVDDQPATAANGQTTVTQPAYDVDKLFMLGATKVDGADPENVFTINGRAYPYTPQMTVQKGQRVLLRLVNSSAEDYHAITLDGYPLTIVAEDGQPLPDPQQVSVVSIAPSETLDVAFTASRAGDWWFHSTIASELSNPDDTADTMGGMMTLIHVK